MKEIPKNGYWHIRIRIDKNFWFDDEFDMNYEELINIVQKYNSNQSFTIEGQLVKQNTDLNYIRICHTEEKHTVYGKGSNSYKYITRCQTENIKIETEFPKLLNKIIFDTDTKTSKFNHDIDLLFKDKQTGVIYYLECKYNDDHDTGKFVDINRKFIKTYAYLARELNIKDSSKLVPILFFFTNKKMKGNIYVPEETNIYRGKRFFEKFLNIKYEEVDEYLSNLSEDEETIKSFKNLYDKIMNIGL